MSLTSSYDPSVDALYLCARPGTDVRETVEVDPRVLVDRDAEGVAIGVELLGAARHGIPVGLLARTLGSDLVDAQQVADAAQRAMA